MGFFGSLGNMLTSPIKGVMNLFGGGNSNKLNNDDNALRYFLPNGQPNKSGLDWGSMWNPQSILGTGLTALGLFKGLPKAPKLPDSVNQLKGQVQSGGSPLGQFAKSKLTDQLNQNYEPLSEPEIQAALRQLDLQQQHEVDQVNDLYKNLRPGSDPSTDSTYQKDLAEVNDRYSKAKADQLATRTRETKSIFDQQRSQQIQQAIGASDSEMQQLYNLAQLDVSQIMAQLQLDYAQAAQFKETFTNLGTSLLTTGLGGNNNLMNLFNLLR